MTTTTNAPTENLIAAYEAQLAALRVALRTAQERYRYRARKGLETTATEYAIAHLMMMRGRLRRQRAFYVQCLAEFGR
jgi:hypothetical protein